MSTTRSSKALAKRRNSTRQRPPDSHLYALLVAEQEHMMRQVPVPLVGPDYGPEDDKATR